MRRLLPDPVVGAMAGFILGFLTVFPLVSLGVDVSGWVAWLGRTFKDRREGQELSLGGVPR
jgi:hypothetical protein